VPPASSTSFSRQESSALLMVLDHETFLPVWTIWTGSAGRESSYKRSQKLIEAQPVVCSRLHNYKLCFYQLLTVFSQCNRMITRTLE